MREDAGTGCVLSSGGFLLFLAAGISVLIGIVSFSSSGWLAFSREEATLFIVAGAVLAAAGRWLIRTNTRRGSSDSDTLTSLVVVLLLATALAVWAFWQLGKGLSGAMGR